MISRKSEIVAMLLCVFLSGCISASQHASTLQSSQDRKLTVGKVQREIRKGMTPAQVAEVMGSPNIVSSTMANSETWIYDKIATEASYSQSSGGIDVMVLGFGPSGNSLLGGGAGGGYRAGSGASSQTQRTLTVVITFASGFVTDFKYHTSTF